MTCADCAQPAERYQDGYRRDQGPPLCGDCRREMLRIYWAMRGKPWTPEKGGT